MKKSLLMFVAPALFLATTMNAQQTIRCGTTEYMNRLKTENPTLGKSLQDYDKAIDDYIQAHPNQKVSTTITIPVIFHVLWNNTAQNISQARIVDQLATLNKDYAHFNADSGNTPSVFKPLAANTNVQFCLATRDPLGNYTSGVIRKQVSVSGFDKISNNNINYTANGGDDAWPRASYLNIWVCNFSGQSSQLLGISQFPNGPGPTTAATDGICVLYAAVGGALVHGTYPGYNLGRTLTHEVGHWLNLRHIWGDDNGSCTTGSDYVTDTPNQGSENYGCPIFPSVSCTNGPNGDMFMNYMDYVDDNCMNLFTAGQSTRLNAALNALPRSSLVSSLGCQAPTGIAGNLTNYNISVYPNPAADNITVSCDFMMNTNAVVTLTNTIGEIVYSKQLDNVSQLELPVDLSRIAKGIYNLSVRTDNALTVKKVVVAQ